MDAATPKEITAFLRDFKRLAQNEFKFIPRKKNLDSLAQLGIRIRQAKDIILQLTYEDYSKGPKEDRDRPRGNLWEFGTKIGDDDVYIKLSDDFSRNIAKCLSFHKAEFEINYPYKKGGK